MNEFGFERTRVGSASNHSSQDVHDISGLYLVGDNIID